MSVEDVLNDAIKFKNKMDDALDPNYAFPDSFMDEGVRKAVIYGGDSFPDKLTLIKQETDKGHSWIVEDLYF